MPKDWKKMTDDELLEYYESEQGLKEQKKLEEVIMRRISKGDEMI